MFRLWKDDKRLFTSVVFRVCVEIVLKTGEQKHYTYDIREIKRDEEKIQYLSKEPMREFVELEEVNNKYSDTLCVDCKDWEKRMKDICFLCDNDFSNSREHYKLNGNMCHKCMIQFQ